MKQLTLTLGVAVLTVLSFNLGLEWGLTSKPVIDLSQCQILTRYEDGSFECDPDGTEKADLSNVSHYQPVEPMTGTDLQPAATAAELQPVLENSRE